jgi:hypothetical protein
VPFGLATTSFARAVAGVSYPMNVSGGLEIVDDLPHCLLRHPQERCEDAQAGAIRWKAFEQHRMRHPQRAMSGLGQASEELGLKRPIETVSHHAQRREWGGPSHILGTSTTTVTCVLEGRTAIRITTVHSRATTNRPKEVMISALGPATFAPRLNIAGYFLRFFGLWALRSAQSSTRAPNADKSSVSKAAICSTRALSVCR